MVAGKANQRLALLVLTVLRYNVKMLIQAVMVDSNVDGLHNKQYMKVFFLLWNSTLVTEK